jgi:transposase
MSERFVNVDRETPMLLPVDLRQWVPEDDLVHFVINAVDTMSLPSLKVNRRGSGSEQYPPQMMLALLVYCYANGVMSSRRIERASYRDIAVRYLTGDTHPDHDTICAFRRDNAAAVQEAFEEVLRIAREMGLVKVGTVSIDGTHIRANASKHKSLRYDRAGELEKRLREDVQGLLEQAEQADREGSGDDERLPEEIARREKLREKMLEARRRLEERAQQEAQAAEEPHGEKTEKRSGGGKKKKHNSPKDSAQINLTDPDSAIMRKSRRDSYQQAYNAQAAVDAEGSQLILATDVIATPSDANEMEPMVEKVKRNVGAPKRVLVDGGYVNCDSIRALQDREVEVYAAVSREDHNYRRYDFRPEKAAATTVKKVVDPLLIAMQEKLKSPEGRKVYGRRCATVEPVFGIIKEPMKFRQFLLRGIENVKTEWNLVCMAYNMKRMWSLA